MITHIVQQIFEDVTTGDVATVSPPLVTARPKKPSGTAFGYDYFDCNDEDYCNCVTGKVKHKRWDHFIKETDLVDGIREYSKANPQKPFLLRNIKTGECCFSRDLKWYTK